MKFNPVNNLRYPQDIVHDHTPQHSIPHIIRSVPIRMFVITNKVKSVNTPFKSIPLLFIPLVLNRQTHQPSQTQSCPNQMKEDVSIPNKLTAIELATLTTKTLKLTF